MLPWRTENKWDKLADKLSIPTIVILTIDTIQLLYFIIYYEGVTLTSKIRGWIPVKGAFHLQVWFEITMNVLVVLGIVGFLSRGWKHSSESVGIVLISMYLLFFLTILILTGEARIAN